VHARQLKALAGVIGLLERPSQQFLQAGGEQGGVSEDAIVATIAQRIAAKKARNFAESDKIRADLLAAGIVLEDKPDGTTNWRRA
jgi:cysteinyl-tRNA synthetase